MKNFLIITIFLLIASLVNAQSVTAYGSPLTLTFQNNLLGVKPTLRSGGFTYFMPFTSLGTGLSITKEGQLVLSGNQPILTGLSDVPGLMAALAGKQATLGYTPYNASNPSGYQTAGDVTTAINNQTGVLKFATYSAAVAGLVGRTTPCRVLITSDTMNNQGGFGKYDYDGSTLIEDIL